MPVRKYLWKYLTSIQRSLCCVNPCRKQDAGGALKTVTHLTLSGRVNRKACRKHDIWIVSNNALLAGPKPCVPQRCFTCMTLANLIHPLPCHGLHRERSQPHVEPSMNQLKTVCNENLLIENDHESHVLRARSFAPARNFQIPISKCSADRVPCRRGWVGDRNCAPWAAICRSLWHGPDKDGKFEIAWLTAPPPASVGSKRGTEVFALRGPDVASDLQVLEFVASGNFAEVPVLRQLLSARATAPSTAAAVSGAPGGALQPGAPGGTCEEAAEMAAAMAKSFNLNEEQADVAKRVAGWLTAGAPPAGDACLIHGPFGTGKPGACFGNGRCVLERLL